MSTDNVLYLKPRKQPGKAPPRLGRNVGDLMNMLEEVRERCFNVPADETPGYRQLPATRAELTVALALVKQTARLVDRAIQREDRRYNAYCDELEAQGIEV